MFKNQKGLSSIVVLIISLVTICVVGCFLFMKIEKISSLSPSTSKNTSFVYLKEVPHLKTGSEVCYEAGLSCLGMSSVKIYDSDDNFYGYVTPSCDSQVIEKPSCESLFGTRYALDKVEYVKSPTSESSDYLTADFFCAFSDEGKKGIFEFAYCVKREL